MIHSVNLEKALTDEMYASQCVRSGKLTAGEKNQIAGVWGSELVKQWESVDSTKYEITDEEKAAARAEGDKKVDEATGGYDGKSDGVKSAAGTAAVGVAAVGSVAVGVAAVTASAEEAPKGFASGWVAAAVGGVLLGLSVALKAMDPNAEQAQACDDLKDVMDDSNHELGDAQDELSDVTNDLTKSTDKLLEESEEANDNTKVKQELYERLQQEYNELVQKHDAAMSGNGEWTDADASRFEAITGMLDTEFTALNNIKKDGDQKIADAKENVASKQETYDDAAEKIEEVQEITDFQAEFDEATVDNSKMVKTAATVGKYAGVVTAAAGAVHLWKWFDGEAAAGAAAIATGGASYFVFQGVENDQADYQQRADAGVQNRQTTEKINTETSDVYEEELDNYTQINEATNEVVIDPHTATETQFVTLSDVPDDSNQIGNNANTQTDINPFAAVKVDNKPEIASADSSGDNASDIKETDEKKGLM